MTYIEFFDNSSVENIIACLTYTPDRVIYIGDNAKRMKRHIQNYEKVFAGRGHEIEFQYRTVSGSKLENMVALLSEIIERYDDCVFDLSGGEELMTFAFGVVYARYPDKNIQIHKLNLRNNAIYDCDKDGQTIYHQQPVLTIEENIRIYGGEIAGESIGDNKSYRWDLNEEFINDINRIWDICKVDVRLWNKQIGALAALATAGTSDDQGLTVTAPRASLEKFCSQYNEGIGGKHDIIGSLLRYGLLTRFDTDEYSVTISYKNKQVKKCLSKAGQALEMKIFTVAKSVLDENGKPVYDDAVNGVTIDWDGVLHDDTLEKQYDTVNEIDVLLIHRVVPVFISCKNGAVTADELYKLSAVAERFGGRYAKKVLVATAIDRMGEAGKYLRQRAKDMHICLIENVQDMNDAELARKLKNLWRN